MDAAQAFDLVQTEMVRAVSKHGDMPGDKIHSVAIMCEESGEALQAALQHTYEKGKVKNITKEVIHTAAMALRILMTLPEYKA